MSLMSGTMVASTHWNLQNLDSKHAFINKTFSELLNIIKAEKEKPQDVVEKRVKSMRNLLKKQSQNR